MTPKKIGLVLAGGGAKGAYGFGCLKAFHEHNIKFHGVSGTSVGALNAFLWSSNSLEQGDAFYKELSFASIYPFKMLNPGKFEKAFLLLNFSFLVIPRIIWSTIKGENVPNLKLFRKLAALTIFLSFLLLSIIVSKINGDFYSFSWKSLAFIAAPSIMMIWFYEMLPQDVYLPFTCLVVFVYLISSCFIKQDMAFTWQLILLFISLVVSAYLSYFFFDIFDKHLTTNSISVFDSTPLKQKLTQIIKNKRLEIPTWVTLATKKDLFDPDNPGWHYSTPPHSLGRDYNIDRPNKPSRNTLWVPKYFRIDTLDHENAIHICAGSAALPYGLVTSPKIDNEFYADGGIIDNCPILPLIETNDFDEIFVVLLSKQDNELELILQKNKLRKADISSLVRLADLAKFNDTTYKEYSYPEMNHPPKHVPYRNVFRKSVKIHLFFPTKNLGGWLSGTLNFSGKYATRLIEMGYQETRNRLKAIGL